MRTKPAQFHDALPPVCLTTGEAFAILALLSNTGVAKFVQTGEGHLSQAMQSMQGKVAMAVSQQYGIPLVTLASLLDAMCGPLDEEDTDPDTQGDEDGITLDVATGYH